MQLRGRQGGERERGLGPQPLHGDRRGAPLRRQQDGRLDRRQILNAFPESRGRSARIIVTQPHFVKRHFAETYPLSVSYFVLPYLS